MKISSFAFVSPIRRGRKYMPPPSGTSPRSTKLITKLAACDAMMKSQQSARSAPRPAAGPLTAAIVTFSSVCSRITVWWSCRCRRQP